MNYVIYHANCQDGFAAAFICWQKLGDQAEYIPCSYQSAMPDMLDNSDVYIVDFSFKRDQLIDLSVRMNKVVVLDHHGTAQEELKDLIGIMQNLEIIFNQEKCGTILTWEYFNPNTDVPLLFEYILDRDIWTWKKSFSREVSAWLTLQPREFNHYANVVMNYDYLKMIEEGSIVLKAQQILIDNIVRNHFFVEIDGYSVPVVNSSVLQSECGEALNLKFPESPFAGVFNYPKGPNSVSWSLRSKGDFDVSAVAKKFGGGGHRGAAGFVLNKEQ